MTKDELRAFLSHAVPAAIADGRGYRFNKTGSGKAKLPLPHEAVTVRNAPNTKVTPTPKPTYIDRTTQTYKRFALSAVPHLSRVAERLSEELNKSRSAHAEAARAARREENETN